MPETASDRSRILLTGPTGQVGWELSRTLQALGEVVCASRSGSGRGEVRLDLADPDGLRAAVRAVRPALIVNAAAYTAVDKAETETDLAAAANTVAPGILAEEAARVGAALVHYSTDYIFDGSGQRPWREGDATGPLNVYGATKLDGERAIAASGAAHLILRVSWVYGVHGNNFVKTMLRLGGERESLSIVGDQFGAPTSARVIADVTGQILSQGRGDYAGLLRERGGIVHLVCGGETNWREFALKIFELADRRGADLKVRSVKAIPTSEYKCAAKRPLNSRMDCGLLRERFGLTPPDWETALGQTFAALPIAERAEVRAARAA